MMALMMRAEEILGRVDSTVVLLNGFLEQDRVTHVLIGFEEVARDIRTLVAENRQGLQSTIDRMDALTRTLEADSTFTHLGRVITGLDSAVIQMRRIAEQMESEEGTVGKLIQDRWLYDQVMKTVVDIDSLITDIKANPKKYVRVSVF